MSSLDRKKAYVFAIEKQVGTAPLSSVNIALTVKRWYFDYQSDRRAQVGIHDGGVK